MSFNELSDDDTDTTSANQMISKFDFLRISLTEKRVFPYPLPCVLHQILEQVSSQVRDEVGALVYGNQLTVRGGASDDAGLPESLLQWLSQRYVSGADLQASLASLELSILQNISLQLEEPRSEDTVREAVLHTAETAVAAVTQEVGRGPSHCGPYD